jgi:DNA-binding SARP family transcriptional activator
MTVVADVVASSALQQVNIDAETQMRRSSAASARERCTALRIRLLGGFRVEVGAQVIADNEWRLQKARGLVKLLALAPRHGLGREHVMDRLWPEVEPEAALNSLYYALHVARGALDRQVAGETGRPSALQLARGVLALAPGGSVTVDVEAFEAAAASAWETKDPRAYRAALELYAGELLPEDRYEDWTGRRREALREVHVRLLWELAGVQQERGDVRAAQGTLSRLVAEEPIHEEARARLMRLHCVAGERWHALREYAQLRTALREELDVEPGLTTQQLYAEILAGRAGAEPAMPRDGSTTPMSLARSR